jgi:hypothetical protein
MLGNGPIWNFEIEALGFGWDRGLPRLHFEYVAFLMNSLPVFIGLDGFKLHGFIAQGTDRESKNCWQVGSPMRIIRLHKRPTPERGTAEGCVKRRTDHTLVLHW